MSRKGNRGAPAPAVKPPPYYGDSRFIEIMPPGIPFRTLANVSHITSISFSEKREQVEIRTEGGVGQAAVLDDDGNELTPAVPPPTHTESRVVGFQVAIGIGGQNNEFTFRDVEVAIAFYNGLVEGVATLTPSATLQPLFPPPPPEEEGDVSSLLDANGNPMTADNDEVSNLDQIDELDDDALPGQDSLEDETPVEH